MPLGIRWGAAKGKERETQRPFGYPVNPPEPGYVDRTLSVIALAVLDSFPRLRSSVVDIATACFNVGSALPLSILYIVSFAIWHPVSISTAPMNCSTLPNPASFLSARMKTPRTSSAANRASLCIITATARSSDRPPPHAPRVGRLDNSCPWTCRRICCPEPPGAGGRCSTCTRRL